MESMDSMSDRSGISVVGQRSGMGQGSGMSNVSNGGLSDNVSVVVSD